MSEPIHNSGDQWLPLMDYAIQTGISVSTIRRHIKANKIIFRIENGRYLLLAPSTQRPITQVVQVTQATQITQKSEAEFESALQLRGELTRLSWDLKKAREEIAELKTLIALYEENAPG